MNGYLLAELPIDARAVVRITSEDTSAVSGAGELNKRIVGSTKVSSCMTKNYFRFATRREPTKAGGDSCVSEALTRELANPSVGLATVFKHLAKEPNFRQRKVGAQ